MSTINCSQCNEAFYVTKRNLVLPFVCAECQEIENQGAQEQHPSLIPTTVDRRTVTDEPLKASEILTQIKEELGDPRITAALYAEGVTVDWDRLNQDIIGLAEIEAKATASASEMIGDLSEQLTEQKDIVESFKNQYTKDTDSLFEKDQELDQKTFEIAALQKQIAALKGEKDLNGEVLTSCLEHAFGLFLERNSLQENLKTVQRLSDSRRIDLAYHEGRHEYWKDWAIKYSCELSDLKFKNSRPWSTKFWEAATDYISRWRTRG